MIHVGPIQELGSTSEHPPYLLVACYNQQDDVLNLRDLYRGEYVRWLRKN